jgi:pilus assembly protein CpaB
VTARARRNRAFVLLLAAVTVGAGAAMLIERKQAAIDASVGALQPVVVTTSELRQRRTITPALARRLLTTRQVPARFVPPDALQDPAQAVGYAAVGTTAAGDYLTSSDLVSPRQSPARDPGGRVIDVAIAGGESLIEQAAAGAPVDVVITSETGNRVSYLALQRIELLRVSPSSGTDASTSGDARPTDAIATLRVTLRQAITLTAAQNFAREIRLVPRPSADRRAVSGIAVRAADLHP